MNHCALSLVRCHKFDMSPSNVNFLVMAVKSYHFLEGSYLTFQYTWDCLNFQWFFAVISNLLFGPFWHSTDHITQGKHASYTDRPVLYLLFEISPFLASIYADYVSSFKIFEIQIIYMRPLVNSIGTKLLSKWEQNMSYTRG